MNYGEARSHPITDVLHLSPPQYMTMPLLNWTRGLAQTGVLASKYRYVTEPIIMFEMRGRHVGRQYAASFFLHAVLLSPVGITSAPMW